VLGLTALIYISRHKGFSFRVNSVVKHPKTNAAPTTQCAPFVHLEMSAFCYS